MLSLMVLAVFLLFGVPGLLLAIARLLRLNQSERRSGGIIGYPIDLPPSAGRRNLADDEG